MLLGVASPRQMPFGMLQSKRYMNHGITFVIFCVLFLFADRFMHLSVIDTRGVHSGKRINLTIYH